MLEEDLNKEIVAKIERLYLRYTILVHIGNILAFFALTFTNQLTRYAFYFLATFYVILIFSVRRIVRTHLNKQEQKVLDQLKYLL